MNFLRKVRRKINEDWLNSVLAEIEDLGTQPVEASNIRRSIKVSTDYDNWNNQVKKETFQEQLMKHIETKGMTGKDFYKAANIDRKLFSAIKNNSNYQPKKETAVACCLGLDLCWSDAKKLLEAAGYTLSLSISWDRVIYYCLYHGITDVDMVNEILYAKGEKCIGIKE